jgi:transcriptional regulator with XRE-family HTH domain
MSITPEVNAKTLTQLVATEVKVQMARADVRQSQLAREIGKTEQWLSVRLRGRQPIDINDLALIARGLNVGIHDLLPPPEEAAQAVTSPSAIPRYLQLPDRIETHTDRPRDNRPAGKPGSGRSAGGVRTSYVSRRPRGRQD